MHRRSLAIAFFALSAAALPQGPCAACSVCGCGDPLARADDPVATTSRFVPQLETEILSVTAGNEEDPALEDDLDQFTVRLNAVYNPTWRLTLIGTLPYVHKRLSVDGTAVSTSTGVGDAELGARYAVRDAVNLFARRRQSVAAFAGTSFPTGSNGAASAGERVDEHGQIGTGSWGPYAGIGYTFEQNRWAAKASVSGRVHSGNAHDYRYGSALLWSVQGRFRPLRRLALGLGVDGRDAATDSDGDEDAVNTGGSVIAAGPAVYWIAAGPMTLTLRAQFPIYTNLLGMQSVGATVNAGVQWMVF